MTLEIPAATAVQITAWESLSRWEKAEVGRDLRRLGLTYGEIRDVIPVPKGTLAGWCRDIRLSDDQVKAITDRTGSVRGVPRDTQWRRRVEVERIREEATLEVPELMQDPLWVAGTVLSWGEGSKTSRRMELANSDADALRLFIAWVRRYHASDAVFVLALNLHAENDEPAARAAWQRLLGLEDPAFTKTFIKPDGTGHRKNHIPHGVCRVRVRRSTDAWLRTMGWIAAFPRCLGIGN